MEDSQIVGPDGEPARWGRVSTVCPNCHASQAKRIASGGFGPDLHDVCGVCGWEFEEYTCQS